ncbi:MAG: HNH endonuclease [bacterium]|nr:HNH endonuclease [bacterium]
MKPWRVCQSAQERLSPANGLALAPHVDRVFDLGLISFASDGALLRSPTIGTDELQRLGLAPEACLRASSLRADQGPFLTYHRDHILKLA